MCIVKFATKLLPLAAHLLGQFHNCHLQPTQMQFCMKAFLHKMTPTLPKKKLFLQISNCHLYSQILCAANFNIMCIISEGVMKIRAILAFGETKMKMLFIFN